MYPFGIIYVVECKSKSENTRVYGKYACMCVCCVVDECNVCFRVCLCMYVCLCVFVWVFMCDYMYVFMCVCVDLPRAPVSPGSPGRPALPGTPESPFDPDTHTHTMKKMNKTTNNKRTESRMRRDESRNTEKRGEILTSIV